MQNKIMQKQKTRGKLTVNTMSVKMEKKRTKKSKKY